MHRLLTFKKYSEMMQTSYFLYNLLFLLQVPIRKQILKKIILINKIDIEIYEIFINYSRIIVHTMIIGLEYNARALMSK